VYELPITMAARELNIGVTVLKKYCRKLQIMRWPHRKLMSVRGCQIMHSGLVESTACIGGKRSCAANGNVHGWAAKRTS
jgi:hypothetical protein